MRAKLSTARDLLRYMGPLWLAFRVAYAAERRLGILQRRTPPGEWSDIPLESSLNDSALANPATYFEYRQHGAPRFFFTPSCRPRYARLLRHWDGPDASPVATADRLRTGQFPYFGGMWLNTGYPPDWHRNALTGERAPDNRHWAGLDEFAYGDVRVIWEANRFGFVYPLVRAYWRTGEERYAEWFWELVENWRSTNKPNTGINWKCGQEVSFRVMAWCFGLYGFLDAPATTPARVRALAEMVAASGRRIRANIGYAASQSNNHVMSEAVGLWTLGLLFPEFRAAAEWRSVGRRILHSAAAALIYSDGAFAQHSVNYHRLMLHDYIWAMRLGDLHGDPFTPELREWVGRAGDFLASIEDSRSGGCPMYGPNDGSLVLPLNNCSRSDFRPVTQAASVVCRQTRRHCPGPWDEDLLWLAGPDALQGTVASGAVSDLNAAAGGYYTMRSLDGFAMVRAAKFRHRPGHADLLHTDVWWRGQNICIDAGTFSYNAPAPWDNVLARSRYHNTVTVDDADQSRLVSRFLWLPWPRGSVLHSASSPKGLLGYWEGDHDGYARSCQTLHRRGILRIGDGWWLILDVLRSRAPHRYRLHWLVADFPHVWDSAAGRLALATPAGPYGLMVGTLGVPPQYSMVRGDSQSARGWQAPGYWTRREAISIECAATDREVRFWSLLGPDPGAMEVGPDRFAIDTETMHVSIDLAAGDTAPLILRAAAHRPFGDLLEVSP